MLEKIVNTVKFISTEQIVLFCRQKILVHCWLFRSKKNHTEIILINTAWPISSGFLLLPHSYYFVFYHKTCDLPVRFQGICLLQQIHEV